MNKDNIQSFSKLTLRTSHAPRLLCAVLATVTGLTLSDACGARAGRLDPTFGQGGKVQTTFGANSSYLRHIALQADGKLVAVGYSGIYPGFNSAIARYNSDGTLDSSFGTNGTVVSHFRTTDSFNSVSVQPDGKIIAVGEAANTTQDGNGTDILVVRYNSNGTLDSTFGVNGAVITSMGSAPPGVFVSSAAVDVTTLTSGKLLVGGYTITVDLARMALLRYNSNGTLDQTYGSAGLAIIDFPVGGYSGGAYAAALALQADGKALLAGSYSDNSFSEFALARLNANGTADTSFGTDGRVTTSLGAGDATGAAVLVQPDGKILVGGYFEVGDNNHDFALARYQTNGTPDPSFGLGGVVTNDLLNQSDDVIKGLALQADGRIIAGGQTGQYPTFDFGLARYTARGRLDKTFGRNGVVSTNFGSFLGNDSFDAAYGVVLAPDGKIVAAGETDAGTTGSFDFALSRYLNP